MIESLETKVSQVIAELSEVKLTSELRALEIKNHVKEKDGFNERIKAMSTLLEDLQSAM